MNIKKIAAFAAAAVMAAGICTGVPVGTENTSLLAVTAEAADSDFVIKSDSQGYKYVAEYKGKGGDIKIPSGISFIGTKVFAGNDTITSVTFPKSCDLVLTSSFAECTNLKKVVFEGNAAISQNAFEWCISLESVTVKGSIETAIGSAAFYGCSSLKTVKIEKNEMDFAIGSGAFRDCFSLTSINIPDKCTEIYACAFLNCFSLTKLTIPEKTKINTDNGGECHFGYAAVYKTKDGFEDAKLGGSTRPEIFVADGKKSGYYDKYSVLDDAHISSDEHLKDYFITGYYYGICLGAKKYTPKQLTVTVTKGSSAEKWAKANKVKYVYAKSSAGSKDAAAPSNVKASSTKNSVTLTWDKADGADMYRVYKYNDKTKKYEKYKDVTSAKCTVSGLSANTKYKFKITAYNKINGKYVKGKSSSVISVTTASAKSSSAKSDKKVVGNDTAGYITTYFDYKYTKEDDGSFSIVSTDGKDRTDVFFYDNIQTDLDQTAYMFCLAAAMNAESDGFEETATSAVNINGLDGYFAVALDNDEGTGFKLYLYLVDSENEMIRALTHESTRLTSDNVLAASAAFDSYSLKKS